MKGHPEKAGRGRIYGSGGRQPHTGLRQEWAVCIRSRQTHGNPRTNREGNRKANGRQAEITQKRGEGILPAGGHI